MKVIEFLGMPRAGKTTQLWRLEKYLRNRGKKVCVLLDRERALELSTPPNEIMAYQFVFFSRAIEEYFKALKRQVDFLIIDRGFQDALVWADVLYFVGAFTKKERDADKECFFKFTKLVDQTFYFSIDIDMALKRHDTAAHEAVDDVAMNKKWLTELAKVYQMNLKKFRNPTIIDGALSISDAAQLIKKKLIR